MVENNKLFYLIYGGINLRLVDIEKIIEGNINYVNISYLNIAFNDNKSYGINGHLIVINAIEELNQISVLREYTLKLMKITAIYNKTTEMIFCSPSQYQDFSIGLTELQQKCSENSNIIKSLIGDQDSNTISIKLPEIRDLNRFVSYIQRLERLLSQLVCNEQIDGKVELSKVDSGSIWLDIFLGGQAAVTIVGSAVWAAAVIRKKFLEGEIAKKSLDVLQINTDVIESMKNQIDKELESMQSNEAENIFLQNGFNLDDNEYKSRCIYSVKELYKLILEGVEVHTSLTAPEEVKNLFPNFKILNIIESKIPKLEEQNNA